MALKLPDRRRRWRWRSYLPWLVALSLLLWIWLQTPWPDIAAILRTVPAAGLLALVTLDAVIVLSMGARWWLVLVGMRHRLNYLQISGYRLAAMGVSYFTPGPQFGGEPLQVWVLKSRHHLSGSTALASVAVDKLLELMVNFAVLSVGVTAVFQATLLPGSSAGWTLAAALILWSAPVTLLLLMARGHAPLSRALAWMTARHGPQSAVKQYAAALARLETGMRASEQKVADLCRRAPGYVVLALLATLLNWALWLLEFWLMYALLGLRMSATELLIVLTAARIAFLLPLPGGLGTLEASQFVAVTAIGQPAAIGIGAALLIRVRDVLIGGLGLWLSSRLIPTRRVE